MQNKTTNIRKLTGTAMLGAVAAVLMYMEFPIPIMPSFIKLDVSELPALLAAYAYGPVSGIAVCLIKNLIKLPSTSTAAVGELFNFVMGALFVGVAGFVYKRSKTRRSALIGAGLGALIMAVVSVPYNYFIVYPAYVVLYHLPLEAIIGMYQAINPSVDGLLTCLITFNFPFTLFKGLLDAALCFLIYKPLSGGAAREEVRKAFPRGRGKPVNPGMTDEGRVDATTRLWAARRALPSSGLRRGLGHLPPMGKALLQNHARCRICPVFVQTV